MDPNLVDSLALEEAILNSGGVFREMARVMRTAIGRSSVEKQPKLISVM